jgi:hypothetical protein
MLENGRYKRLRLPVVRRIAGDEPYWKKKNWTHKKKQRRDGARIGVWTPSLEVLKRSLNAESESKVWNPSLVAESESREFWKQSLEAETQSIVWKHNLEVESDSRTRKQNPEAPFLEARRKLNFFENLEKTKKRNSLLQK